jgi:hypothetical protein
LRSSTAVSNVVSVVGDDTNCYVVGALIGIQPIWDYDVIAEFVDCPTCEATLITPTPTPTQTTTPTNTPSITPTETPPPTPTPAACKTYRVDYILRKTGGAEAQFSYRDCITNFTNTQVVSRDPVPQTFFVCVKRVDNNYPISSNDVGYFTFTQEGNC